MDSLFIISWGELWSVGLEGGDWLDWKYCWIYMESMMVIMVRHVKYIMDVKYEYAFFCGLGEREGVWIGLDCYAKGGCRLPRVNCHCGAIFLG